jgi:predicted transcriptional regulator
MRIVWELGEATVDHVRAAQPRRRRCAYNTIQTVLNRLHERDLLTRERRGKAFVHKALLHLVEALDPDELDDVARLANRIRRGRKRR